MESVGKSCGFRGVRIAGVLIKLFIHGVHAATEQTTNREGSIMSEPIGAPGTPAAPAAASPPSGGGIGSQPVGGVISSNGSPTPAPVQQTLEQMTLAAMGQPAGLPAIPTPAAAAAAGVTPEQYQALQAELQALKASQLPPDQLQALRDFAQLGRNAWLQQQQQQQQAPVAAAPTAPQANVWGVIPFSESDRAMLVADETAPGGVRAIPGAPADLVPRFLQHQASRRAAMDQLLNDPAKVLMPLIQQEALRIAQEQATQVNQQAAQMQIAQQIQAQNEPWLYQRGPDGNAVVDVMGKKVFTPEGQLYLSHIEKLHNNGTGITDARELDRMAKYLVAGHAVFSRQQQAAPAPAAAPAAPAPAPAAPAAPAFRAPMPSAIPQTMTAQQLHALQQQQLLEMAAKFSGATPLQSTPVGQLPVQQLFPGVQRGQSLMDMARAAAPQLGLTI